MLIIVSRQRAVLVFVITVTGVGATIFSKSCLNTKAARAQTRSCDHRDHRARSVAVPDGSDGSDELRARHLLTEVFMIKFSLRRVEEVSTTSIRPVAASEAERTCTRRRPGRLTACPSERALPDRGWRSCAT